MTDDSLLERRHAAMGRGAMAFYDEPIELARGEGIWLFDGQGKRYMDIYNNVPVAGHCHPRIVEAMQRQASTLNTHSRYVNDTVLAYSERLMALHAEPLSSLVACVEAASIIGGERDPGALDIPWHGVEQLPLEAVQEVQLWGLAYGLRRGRRLLYG